MEPSQSDPFLEARSLAMELTGIAESGLAYSTNEFDIERFHRVGELAQRLMEQAGASLGPYRREIASIAGYATPKLDVRGGVFNDAGDVLLVREIADGGRWTLPGGWCDILETPTSAVEREVREEAGLEVSATHLAGVFDREVWPHVPAFDRHMYKLLFVCRPLQPLDEGYSSLETSGVGWFSVGALPTLSISRILPEQIEILYEHWRNPGPAYVD